MSNEMSRFRQLLDGEIEDTKDFPLYWKIKIYDKLRCVGCGGNLAELKDCLKCMRCGRRYKKR